MSSSSPPVKARGNSKQDEIQEDQPGYYIRYGEKPKSIGTRVQLFLWNPSTKQFMGRTGSSWCKYS